MAWSWSHSPEAYASAEANLRSLPHETLAEIYAEWQAERGNPSRVYARLDANAYDVALRAAETVTADDLATTIWERTAELRTCTNGGHEAWCCPYGCHTVPFQPDNPENEH